MRGRAKEWKERGGAGLVLLITLSVLSAGGRADAQTPLETTIEDFFLLGTQPNSLTHPILRHNDTSGFGTNCMTCHNNTDGYIVRHWQGSIMAHAARDPLFYACLDIADHVAPGSGDLCIRCHVPKAWLEGRSVPTNGSAITAADRDAINCNFCHRMVDPANPPGEPEGDAAIIAALLDGPPLTPGNGSYVVDPIDLRRGPFADAQCDPFHSFAVSPFFQKADLCGTCHDVSNPVYWRTSENTYVLGPLNERHASGDKLSMRPVERTYSEWLNSAYAIPPGVDSGGRFGGPDQIFVSSCQDCHMPKTTARGCSYPEAPVRDDMPRHHLNGAANWVLDAVLLQYGPSGKNELSSAQQAAIPEAKARNIDMLQRAASLGVNISEENDELIVRVTNETGHKLPSGYPEGRRIWLNVKFRDCFDNIIVEHGHYDYADAELTTEDTKVYEMVAGIDEAVAAVTGLPEGHSFYFVLNNVTLKDNRIPPRGFSNAAFAAVQAEPVACYYADGQYWDETVFAIPPHAVYAEIELFYQTSSKEYIEFLRDNNPNPPPNNGTILYDLWLATGKSAPISMAASGPVVVAVPGDVNGDRILNVADVTAMIDVLLGRETDPLRICAADLDGITGVNGADIQPFVNLLLNP